VLIIEPDGLFHGDRLRRCSNTAQLHWPRLFLASNGFGRLELNYARIVGKAYASFNPIPSEIELQAIIQEYIKAQLLFPYQFDGQLWAVWDTPAKLLPRYKTSEDRRSPIPPEPEFSQWKRRYRDEVKAFPKSFGKLSETFPHAVAVAVAVANPILQVEDVSLLANENSSELNEVKSTDDTLPAKTAHQATLDAVATSIHARHPSAHGRRDCGVGMVKTQLTAILKHKRVPAGEREQYLWGLDANHATMCGSEQWQKDGGEFAKALSNWLAPTKERYDVMAEVNAVTDTTPRYVL
jgi:hypothetical protein